MSSGGSERFIVFLEPIKQLFTKIDVNRALRIEPSLPGAGPVKLMIPAVVGYDLFPDLAFAVNLNKPTRRNNCVDVRFCEPWVVISGLRNPPERRNVIFDGFRRRPVCGSSVLTPNNVLESLGGWIRQHAPDMEALSETPPV